MKTIMVAPLNWGLGHATRCIPLIEALQTHGFKVLIASDGPALQLLQKEFPDLESIELPAYRIKYPSKGVLFKWSIFFKLPHFYQTMRAEERVIGRLIKDGSIDGIISDGRFGVRASSIPSIYITHQLNVLTGNTSWISSKMHQSIIKKFHECWVPDVNHEALNHSGRLGHLKTSTFPIKYFGIVSRMKKNPQPISIDILVLISGPEPQRAYLESILKKNLKKSKKTIVMVRGVVEEEQIWEETKNIRIVNFMKSSELEQAINSSEVIISRPGYSTVMDLSLMEKKVFFIPTPGQFEQEYLAKRLKHLGIAPYCEQHKFRLDKLNEVPVYHGLKPFLNPHDSFVDLFSLFQGKRKL